MNMMPVGVDLAKNIFRMHYVNGETGEVVNRSIKRANFLEHFANLEPCLIGMEAGGGAHHWARELTKIGHEVKLMSGRFVKAFNIGNKNDAGDAKAIWLAVQQPVKSVGIKTEMQQAMLSLHRMREQLVKFRTMQINGLRGLLAEYGEVFPAGRPGLNKGMSAALSRLSEILPGVLIDSLRTQWSRIKQLDEEIQTIEHQLQEWKKEDATVNAISKIPGVGLLGATAAVAIIGDPKSFKSGREFSAYLGLVPKQKGSGGKVQLQGISKRGDTYLRKLLIHGARSVLANSKSPGEWVEDLKKRKPFNVNTHKLREIV